MSDRTQTSHIPGQPRIRLAHAALQAAADELGIRILHIKGPALHESLLRVVDGKPQPRGSTDADILVEPRDARRFIKVIRPYGWQQYTSFASGSPFGHAATMWHEQLGYADIHRYFPGIGIPAEKSFMRMWRARRGIDLARRICWVPSVEHQRLILLLHAARSSGNQSSDYAPAWGDADDATRQRVRELAAQFRADLPLAAAIGELDQWKGDRRHDLWHQFSTNEPHGRTDEWVARIKAANGPIDGAKIAVRSLFVNTDHLAMKLGRQPTRKEIWSAWISRFRRAADETHHDGGL